MEKKKNQSVDYTSKRNLFLAIGLCTSLSIILSAFQITSSIQSEMIVDTGFNQAEDFTEIEQTKFEEPQPPKVPEIKVIEVEDDTEIPEVDIPLDNILIEEDIIDNVVFDKLPKEEPVETGIVIAEVQASFPGGVEAWVKFLKKNLEYPKRAKRAGIDGRVFLNFIVDKAGNVSDVEVTRGIGNGCDDEAVRVLKLSPKWNPGLQRGHAVKSRMSLFINFVLR